MAHVHDAVVDMIADESYHLPTEANHTCLILAKAVLSDLKSLSVDSSNFCTWLVNQLEQIVKESFFETKSHLNKEKLWSNFYQFQVSEVLRENGTPIYNYWTCQLKPYFFKAAPVSFMTTS